MINFNDYYYFAQVVEHSGITAASKVLNLPKSKLSRRIAELESRLGARLIQRTSRQFRVTDLGMEFNEHVRKMMAEASAAENAVKSRLLDQAGTIRLSSSPLVSRLCFAQIIPDFLRRFPNVDVMQEVLNRPAEMSGRMSDLFILAHDDMLDDSSMIQRRLLVEPRHLVAGRSYLSSAALPAGPDDLAAHSLLAVAETAVPARWELAHLSNGSRVSLYVKPRLISNDVFALADAVRAGAGIAALPASLCAESIENGDLVRLLPDWAAGTTTISALLPSRRGVLPAVRALLDHVCRQLPAIVSTAGGQGIPVAAAQ